jgi:hypothetical protein
MWGIGVIVTAWCIAGTVCSMCQRIPLESDWNTAVHGLCINYEILVLVIGMVNIITDFVILALSAPLVWQLRIPKRRILLAVTFAIGGR